MRKANVKLKDFGFEEEKEIKKVNKENIWLSYKIQRIHQNTKLNVLHSYCIKLWFKPIIFFVSFVRYSIFGHTPTSNAHYKSSYNRLKLKIIIFLYNN